MKKNLLLLLLSISSITSAQVIDFPDVNLKTKLLSLNIDTNSDGEIEVAEASSVTELDISAANITNLTGLQHFTNVTWLDCRSNQITSLAPLASLQNLEHLQCRQNLLTDINAILSLPLISLDCSLNQISSIDITALEDTLSGLICTNNQITNLNLGNSTLNDLSVHNNLLTTLTYHHTGYNMAYLGFAHNPLTELNLSGEVLVLEGSFAGTTLDFSNLTFQMMEFESATLVHWNLKNGDENSDIDFEGSNLQYVCADEGEIEGLSYQFSSGVNINSYCSFTPGGDFYTVAGQNKFDIDGNDCDASDVIVPNLKFTLANGTDSGVYISDQTGDYSIALPAGMHTVTPVIENADYFVVTPTTLSLDFPTMSSPFAQNFCLSANNGAHPDLEIITYALNAARPGFDSNYRILLKNNGTTMESGMVSFDYDESILDFVSADAVPTAAGSGNLTFAFTDLMPFEAVVYNVTLNVNSPTDIPAVHIGDEFTILTTLSPVANDQNMVDNSSTLNETVVGAFDPNDITCLEGESVSPEMAGQYVHYVIRFENTGNYPATNVVVKDMIDLTKFDLNTLVPMHASHDFVTRITENKVEFIFENIMLPFNDADNDGYIAFKIKIKPSLAIGDTFTQQAEIFFDFNHPIVTNTATTTINALSRTDHDLTKSIILYPNPSSDVLTIKSSTNVTSYSVMNMLGQTLIHNNRPDPNYAIDISGLVYGNYLLKVVTNEGTSTEKFIKM